MLKEIIETVRLIGALSGQPDTTAVQPEQDTLIEKNKIEVESGYNAIEAGITNEGNLRTRVLSEGSVETKKVNVGYSGLNELTSDLKGYFGINKINIGLANKDWKLAGVYKMDSEGIFDAKYGMRFNINEKLGINYGYIDITFDKDGGNMTAFLGKAIGGKSSLELYSDTEIPFEGKAKTYSELQLNTELKNNLKIYVRGEMAAIDYKNATVVVGIKKEF